MINSRKKSPENIILIVCDSLRFDTVYERTNNDHLAMPYVEANSQQYLNACSNASWTLPSTASIFTGLYPHEHRATTRNRVLRKDAVTLAQKLRNIGYQTIQITGNAVTTNVFGLNKRFDRIGCTETC